MPKPIPHDIRIQIIREHQKGTPLSRIAKSLGYSVGGVRKIWKRYQAQGDLGLLLRYERCGRRSIFDGELRELIASVKDGDQGAPYVRSLLTHQYPERLIPHERTIQRWWKASGTNRAKVARRRSPKQDWAKQPHDTWQIDGKEQISLRSGQQVSWLNIADEASSAVLDTTVFSPQQDVPAVSSTGNSGH